MESFKPSTRHIVVVQYGDYAEAVFRFQRGGKENYYAQKYTVDYFADLATRADSVTVVSLSRDFPREKLPNGVYSLGLLLYPAGRRAREPELIRAVAQLEPTDLIIASPITSLIRWGVRNDVETLPIFADSFLGKGLRGRARNFLLQRLLNKKELKWVANHNVAASMELQRIGVNPGKVLPYDWPPLVSPTDYEPKEAPRIGGTFRLLYVGLLSEQKGVGDVLRALPLLTDCTLTVIGSGPDDLRLRSIAELNGTLARVSFRGKVAHDDVLSEMRAHDAVVVPSRHEYPEGLPMTIYEALCTKTPLLVSDHPMFCKRIVAGVNGLVFRAADPDAISDAVNRLRVSPSLYQSLSIEAGEAAKCFLCPLKWHLLLNAWLAHEAGSEEYLSGYSLGRYEY